MAEDLLKRGFDVPAGGIRRDIRAGEQFFQPGDDLARPDSAAPARDNAMRRKSSLPISTLT